MMKLFLYYVVLKDGFIEFILMKSEEMMFKLEDGVLIYMFSNYYNYYVDVFIIMV